MSLKRPDADREQAFLEQLKISVLTSGIRTSADALARIGGERSLTTREYPTTGGLACRIGDVYLNAPFNEWFCDEADVSLERAPDGLALGYRGRQFRLDEVFPLPHYVGKTNSSGESYDDVVFSHLDRVRLSPITGCAHDCQFCDLPGRIELRPLERLIDAAEVAVIDTQLPIRHMLISGGSPGPAQEREFARILTNLITHFAPRMDVDVMMSPSAESTKLIPHLVEAGLHGVSLNMELASDAASSVFIRSKHRRARSYLAPSLDAAVNLLGCTGRVRSLIVPGLEPVECTLEGVEFIASRGADPVLSPFRPAAGTKLATRRPVSSEDLQIVLAESRSIVRRHGVALGPRCLPCQHNTLSFPWDVADGS